MKIKFICSALFFGTNAQRGPAAQVQAEVRPDQSDRRYFQLTDMMTNYNPDFDERKFWAYGCQCLILGDRPMSDPGHGQPIDPLDRVCKEYKDCLKCARMNHGDSCIGEMVKYRYNIKNNEVRCLDKPEKFSNAPHTNACKRSLCECDAAFARAHPAVKHHFSNDYHLFWTTIGWEPQDEANCVRYPGFHEPECCGTPTTPYKIFNAHPKAQNQKQCCNGVVKDSCEPQPGKGSNSGKGPLALGNGY